MLRIEAWQRAATAEPILWTGDLDDDCTAEWAGLMLRAEEIERRVWWWAVYDAASGTVLCDSHSDEVPAAEGVEARNRAESAARRWLTAPHPGSLVR